MSDLQNLIGRLEKASGPDRELDNAIAEELGWTFMEPWALSEAYWVDADGNRAAIPFWTSSIDSALTLVPEGVHVLTLVLADERGNAPFGAPSAVYTINGSTVVCKGATPAIALCIAALRALATQQDGRE